MSAGVHAPLQPRQPPPELCQFLRNVPQLRCHPLHLGGRGFAVPGVTSIAAAGCRPPSSTRSDRQAC
jgi:hypothetical protein